MKKLFCITFYGLFFLAGCTYDKGYEDAWEDKSEPSAWASQEEKDGYEDGLDDACMYDDGYYDGFNGNKPKYFNDAFYMDGYEFGKKDH